MTDSGFFHRVFVSVLVASMTTGCATNRQPRVYVDRIEDGEERWQEDLQQYRAERAENEPKTFIEQVQYKNADLQDDARDAGKFALQATFVATMTAVALWAWANSEE